MNKQLKLSFGAMSEKLYVQIIDQGFNCDKKEVSHLQKDIDALNRLRIRGYIPDGQIGKLNQKIFNKIAAHVNKMNQ